MEEILDLKNASQNFLDGIAELDKITSNLLVMSDDNYGTHRPLLWLAFMLTNSNDKPIIEMGSGKSSTPYLRDICEKFGRLCLSLESDPVWAEKMGSKHVPDWETDEWWRKPCSILFVDHAPGEHRIKAIREMRDKADIIVVHDTELYSAANYGFDSKKGPESVWDEFRYCIHYNRTGGGAGATAVSQTINLNCYKFLSMGNYKFE